MSGAARRTQGWLTVLLVTLGIFVLASGLAACGGGGTSITSAPPSTEGPPATSTPATPHALSPAELAAERREAGRAATFVAPKADNSVPTFGAEGGASQRTQAEANLTAYLQARARGDWPTACHELAAPTRQGLEKLAKPSAGGKAPGCAQILAALSKGTDLADPLTGRLLSLRVQGAHAFALFYGPGHQQYIVPMNREAGQWRPTQVAPIAYPPGAP